MRLFFLCLGLLFLVSCASFQVLDPVTGNPVVDTHGAFLLSRQDDFRITRSWLDENNVMQNMTIERFTDELANDQLRMMEMINAAWAARIPTTTP